MDIRTVVAGVFLLIGCFFIMVAAVGIVRFPDFFSRMHPAGKSDTLGQAMVLLGLMVYEGFTFVSVKLVLIVLFVFIANPTSTHALAKAAYISGLKPWSRKEDGPDVD